MRRTLMIGMLAALLTSSAGAALANGRSSDAGGQDCGRQYRQSYQQYDGPQGSRFDRGGHMSTRWGGGRGMRNDRRFDPRDESRFPGGRHRRGFEGGRNHGSGYGNDRHDRRQSNDGGFDGRNYDRSNDADRDDRQEPTPDRGW